MLRVEIQIVTCIKIRAKNEVSIILTGSPFKAGVSIEMPFGVSIETPKAKIKVSFRPPFQVVFSLVTGMIFTLTLYGLVKTLLLSGIPLSGGC